MTQQDITIEIDAVGDQGDGIGRWQGTPVFVPRTLAGETVSIRLPNARSRETHARLLSVRTASPHRRPAPCAHYEACGGCVFQHADEDTYSAWKTDRTTAGLEKAGLAPLSLLPPVFLPPGTRRRATFTALKTGKTLHLGYNRARSHDIVAVTDCLVVTPRITALLPVLRAHLPALLADRAAADIFVQDIDGALDVLITGLLASGKGMNLAVQEAMADLAHQGDLARLCWRARDRDEPELILQRAPVIKKAGPLAVALPPGTFLQPSAQGEAALVAAVTSAIKTYAPTPSPRIADLFAGSGTFAGPLTVHGPVHAVDSDGPAIAALQALHGHAYAPLTVARRNLFNEPLTTRELAAFDVVVIDPPRVGAKEQAAELAESTVPLVVSVSCNPASFIRDARTLVAGGYIFESVQLIDQFVWSAHAEIVGVFTRRMTRA